MDYNTLTGAKTASGSLRRFINYAELDADFVLEQAQALLYQTLRTREMRLLGTLTANVGVSSVALPAGFLDPIGELHDTTNNGYVLKPEAWLMRQRVFDSTTGLIQAFQPTYYAIFAEALQFESAFDTARTLQLVYYGAPAALSVANPTNFLTARFPHVLLQACLITANEFKKDDAAAAVARQRLADLIQITNAESDLTYRGADIDVDRS